MARKNPERDQVAAAAFVKWKTVNELSDGQIAKMVGRSAAAVATWRNGTRPMARERDVLASLTGWNWDSPPDNDYAPEKDESLTQPKKVKAKKPRRPALDSVEALLLARTTLRDALASKRKLDPTNVNDALTLRVSFAALETEMARRQEEVTAFQKTKSVRDLVLGHRDPKEALRFLREHSAIDAGLLDTIENELPGTQAAA